MKFLGNRIAVCRRGRVGFQGCVAARPGRRRRPRPLLLRRLPSGQLSSYCRVVGVRIIVGTMRVFEGRSAVVTGAASGIGLALAVECVNRGCDVVLADIDGTELEAVAEQLRLAASTRGSTQRVLTRVTDVTKVDAIEALHAFTLAELGKVHLLFNNAGAAGPSSMFASSAAWQWILDLNLNSVIHGVRLFGPTMAAQDAAEECHIVNTASIYGLARGRGPYGVTKQAVVAISEGAQAELDGMAAGGRSHVTVSSLCPSFIATNIMANKARGAYGTHDAPSDADGELRSKLTTEVRDEY
jgi:NAD(P)-dependent dehydrogenase (short-subunit alcohol dehydrogenase family)